MAHGARVVSVAARGYGTCADGRHRRGARPYVIMGDADDSYDFLEVRSSSRAAGRHGLVQGCRLPSGGGTVMPGAMPSCTGGSGIRCFPFLARGVSRRSSRCVCGMRGFTKRPTTASGPALHGDGVRHRDDHQVTACIHQTLLKFPSPYGLMAENHIHRT